MGQCFSTQHEIVNFMKLKAEHDHVEEISLTKAQLTTALNKVASELHSKKLDIVITTVGGAVNTIKLGTWSLTHDVDFYNFELTTAQKQAIAATSDAAVTAKLAPKDWLNSHTGAFIPVAIRDLVTHEALTQKDIVFQVPGLTVYAAPWAYALAAKLDRVNGGNPKTYDITDAANYLHQILQRAGKATIGVSHLKADAERYHLLSKWKTPDALFKKIDDEYLRVYKTHGVDFKA